MTDQEMLLQLPAEAKEVYLIGKDAEAELVRAARLDERYGSDQVEKSIAVSVAAGLIGRAKEDLAKASIFL